MNVIEVLSELTSPGMSAKMTDNKFVIFLGKKEHNQLFFFRKHKKISIENGRFYFDGVPIIRVKPYRDLSTRRNQKRLALLKPNIKAHHRILENLALNRMK